MRSATPTDAHVFHTAGSVAGDLSVRQDDVLVDEFGPAGALVDEHSLLLWQTCAYAEDLTAAARSGQPLTAEYDAMLAFLDDRLLPYLRREERQLPSTSLRDEQMSRLLLADHERLRADVANVAGSRTRGLLAVAVDEMVDRLDRHLRREESWVSEPPSSAATFRGPSRRTGYVSPTVGSKSGPTDAHADR